DHHGGDGGHRRGCRRCQDAELQGGEGREDVGRRRGAAVLSAIFDQCGERGHTVALRARAAWRQGGVCSLHDEGRFRLDDGGADTMTRLFWGALGLATSLGQAAPPPAPCTAPENRQFDFWVGEWQVTKPDGKAAGTNSITREYGGCVIHEHYATPKGYSGEGLNAYDA